MIKKDTLEKYINDGLSQRDIAKKISKGVTTVNYWLCKYGLKTNASNKKRGKTSKIWTINKIELQKIIDSSSSLSQICRVLGLSGNGKSSSVLKERIKKDKISLIQYRNNQKRNYSQINTKRESLDDVLIKNSSYCRTHLKYYLLKFKLLKNKCYECGLKNEWMGKNLVMILDHINGINNDNRIENLRMLCPNCNSQQKTFCRGQDGDRNR